MKNLFKDTYQKWTKKALKQASSLKGTHELLLYLTENELRFATSAPKIPSGREITQLKSINLQNLTDITVVEQLKKFLTDMKISNPTVIAVVPAHWVITRNIEVPSKDHKEIREIVNLQASRHTPYSRNEIVVDYLSLGVFKSVYTKILLVIVPRTAVKRYYNVVEQLDLRIEKIVFAPEAMSHDFSTHPLLVEGKQPSIFVHVDTISSDFMVVHKGVLLYVRNIPIGAQDFATEKDGALSRLVEELKKSIDSYRSENIDQDPASIVLAGAVSGIENLDSLVHEGLQLPAKIWKYEDYGHVRQDAKSAFENQSASYLTVTSSLHLWKQLSIELVPEENRLKLDVEHRAKEIVKTGFLSLICLCLVCAIFASQIYFRKAQANLLARRFAPMRQEAITLEETYARVTTIRNQLAQRGKAIESLSELYQLLPTEVYLRDVKFDDGDTISLKGTSISRPPIFTLVGQLEDSPAFYHVQTKFVSGRTEEGKELSDFEIVASLE